MKKYIKKFIKQIFEEVIEEKIGRIVRLSATASHKEMFSYMGTETMKKIIEEAEKSNKDRYTCLAEIFAQHHRNYLGNRLGEVAHQYYELKPRLDEMVKSFNKIGENN